MKLSSILLFCCLGILASACDSTGACVIEKTCANCVPQEYCVDDEEDFLCDEPYDTYTNIQGYEITQSETFFGGKECYEIGYSQFCSSDLLLEAVATSSSSACDALNEGGTSGSSSTSDDNTSSSTTTDDDGWDGPGSCKNPSLQKCYYGDSQCPGGYQYTCADSTQCYSSMAACEDAGECCPIF